MSSVDNPEYHLTGDEPSAAAPSTVSGDATGSVEASCEPQSPAPTSNGRSLEDESDHEYYNDFDRLQRELQPLRRNETTVWRTATGVHAHLVASNHFVDV